MPTCFQEWSLAIFFVVVFTVFGIWRWLEGQYDDHFDPVTLQRQPWQRWFAYRPVRLFPYASGYAWLRWVERTYVAPMVGTGDLGWFEYRLPGCPEGHDGPLGPPGE